MLALGQILWHRVPFYGRYNLERRCVILMFLFYSGEGARVRLVLFLFFICLFFPWLVEKVMLYESPLRGIYYAVSYIKHFLRSRSLEIIRIFGTLYIYIYWRNNGFWLTNPRRLAGCGISKWRFQVLFNVCSNLHFTLKLNESCWLCQ